jgi:hypothetical protein
MLNKDIQATFRKTLVLWDEDEFEQVAKRIRMLHKETLADRPHDRDTSTSDCTTPSDLDLRRPAARFQGDGGRVEVSGSIPRSAEAFAEGRKMGLGLSNVIRLGYRLPRFELRKALPSGFGTYISLAMFLAVAFIALIATGIRLAEERQKGGLLLRDLAAARRSIEELQAKVEPATAEAKIGHAVEEDRQTRELLGRDLAAVRRSIGTLKTNGKPAAAEQAAAASEEWQQVGFRESRFSFEVPPGFDLAQNAEGGQGATFGRKDGSSLAVWGADLPKPKFRAQIDSQMKQDEENGWHLTYRRVTSNWASYSGIKDGKIRYFRAIALCGNKAAAFRLDYDRREKIAFDPIVVRMVRTLKAEGC